MILNNTPLTSFIACNDYILKTDMWGYETILVLNDNAKIKGNPRLIKHLHQKYQFKTFGMISFGIHVSGNTWISTYVPNFEFKTIRNYANTLIHFVEGLTASQIELLKLTGEILSGETGVNMDWLKSYFRYYDVNPSKIDNNTIKSIIKTIGFIRERMRQFPKNMSLNWYENVPNITTFWDISNTGCIVPIPDLDEIDTLKFITIADYKSIEKLCFTIESAKLSNI